VARMLGEYYHFCGPKGLKCKCCHNNPKAGKSRRSRRREVKRSERHLWRKSVNNA